MSVIAGALRQVSRVSAAQIGLLQNSTRGMATKKEFPKAIDHATGIEKRELVALAAGNKDPFGLEGFKRGVGSKEQPNLIPSMLQKRMIGCVCEEDSTCINYMWLHMGEQKRCECGHWFKLVEGKYI